MREQICCIFNPLEIELDSPPPTNSESLKPRHTPEPHRHCGFLCFRLLRTSATHSGEWRLLFRKNVQLLPGRQMVGRYLVLMVDLHVHTMLPLETIGENTSVEPLMILWARCGALEEKCAVIGPPATVT